MDLYFQTLWHSKKYYWHSYWWHDQIYDQTAYQTNQVLIPAIDYGCTEGFFWVTEFRFRVTKG